MAAEPSTPTDTGGPVSDPKGAMATEAAWCYWVRCWWPHQARHRVVKSAALLTAALSSGYRVSANWPANKANEKRLKV